jgi:predicted PurR-regulated permease PerM
LAALGAGSAIIVIVGFIIIIEIIEDVVKPRMMGRELDLSFEKQNSSGDI